MNNNINSQLSIKLTHSTVVVFFISLFILFSSYSHTIFPLRTNIIGRLTHSDIFGILSLLFSILFIQKLRFTKLSLAWFFLVFTFSIGLLVTKNQVNTIEELLALILLGLIFVVYSTHFVTEKLFKTVVMLIALTTLIVSMIGINDIFSPQTGLPRIINLGSDRRIASGTFRNGGQAGAYLMITIVILFTSLTSKVNLIFTKRDKLIILISLILGVAYFLINVKIAAYIGLGFGILFYFLFRRKIKTMIPIALFSICIYLIFSYLVLTEHRTVNRFNAKYRTRIVANLTDEETPQKEWMYDNYTRAINTFFDSPLLGSGIGGFQNIYDEQEVHSTYLKLLGETGLIGVLGYIVFIYYFLILFRTKGFSKGNPYRDFISNLVPFLFGFFISWGYTYHLRKRFYWLLVFLVYTANYLMKDYERNKIKYMKR